MKPLNAPVAGSDPVFDDGFLHKLERLELLARKIFRGLLRGERTTARISDVNCQTALCHGFS